MKEGQMDSKHGDPRCGDAADRTEASEADAPVERRLHERLLLGGSRAVGADRLMLADATMFAALDGSRPLSAGERRALESSPLTIRRFRVLALQRRTAMPAAANDAQWIGSSGMLRAAASGGPATIARLDTDDGCWTLDFIEDHRGTAASRGKGGWQVIVKLAPDAPFARRLLAEQTMLRVVDGTGAVIMQGRLDADGECEGRWPFESAPGAHFQSRGAGFTVEPLLQGRSSGVPRTPEGA